MGGYFILFIFYVRSVYSMPCHLDDPTQTYIPIYQTGWSGTPPPLLDSWFVIFSTFSKSLFCKSDLATYGARVCQKITQKEKRTPGFNEGSLGEKRRRAIPGEPQPDFPASTIPGSRQGTFQNEKLQQSGEEVQTKLSLAGYITENAGSAHQF